MSRAIRGAEVSNSALSRTGFESEARDAFGELVKRYQNAAIAYAYAILRNHAGAEDAAQAAFLTAWLRRADLREPKAFGSWLRTIVRTECSRIARRMHLATVPLDEAFAGGVEPSTGNVRDPALQHLLLTAIEALPDSDRTVIALEVPERFLLPGDVRFSGDPAEHGQEAPLRGTTTLARFANRIDWRATHAADVAKRPNGH